MTSPLPVRFSLGRVVATPGALAAFGEAGETPTAYLDRHVRGDWGDVDAEDQKANEHALRTGARILSAYSLRSGEKIWVITEAATGGRRASTCILTPDEY